ncbi:sortase [Candidatus Saccharibacteria bacterium]|nr:sortase [Candidatus Saccharibacteria bacterium]
MNINIKDMIFFVLGLGLFGVGMNYVVGLESVTTRNSISAISGGSAEQSALSTENPAVRENGLPLKITIPDTNIDLPVIDGYYDEDSQSWTLTDTNAQFAVMTTRPNSISGNTFIYGHALDDVFGGLGGIRHDSLAYVATDQRQQFVYRFRDSFTVTPEDSSFLSYEGKPILTLQTCSGTFYQNRTIYVFDLKEVQDV